MTTTLDTDNYGFDKYGFQCLPTASYTRSWAPAPPGLPDIR